MLGEHFGEKHQGLSQVLGFKRDHFCGQIQSAVVMAGSQPFLGLSGDNRVRRYRCWK